MTSVSMETFARKTKAVVKDWCGQDLIFNNNLNEKVEMLTLVKFHKKRVMSEMKCTFMELTLFELIKNQQNCPEDVSIKDITVLENFTSWSGTSVGGKAGLCFNKKVVSREHLINEDKTPAFTVKKDIVDLRKLREIWTNPDYEPIEKMLNLQSRHKLAFVNQVLYNANTVTFSKRDEWKRILSTTGIGLNLSIKGKWKEKMPVTVAPGCTFAFSLTVLDSYNGKLVIPIRTRTVKRMHIHGLQNLGQSKTNQYIQQKPQKYNNEEEGENTEDRDGEEEEAAEQK